MAFVPSTVSDPSDGLRLYCHVTRLIYKPFTAKRSLDQFDGLLELWRISRCWPPLDIVTSQKNVRKHPAVL